MVPAPRRARVLAAPRERLSAAGDRLGPRAAAALLAVATGLAVLLIAHEVFPYHSYNHDEAVYLQQAAMLLEGQLTVEPPVVDPLRPWFFVADGGRLYPKYSPVPAAMFALGVLAGGARLALAAVAAAVVALTYATVAEAFGDRRTGVVAAALLAATPLVLVQASVFLPYVPTLAWLLLFAWAYLRADRTDSLRWAGLAGLGIGVAFFARPYTAVLFAAPFVGHALWTIVTDWRDPTPGVPAIRRQATTAAVGLLGVAAALGYNALLTGSPLLFPYEAFAPLDGLGFGRRALWGHGLEYTPGLALESARVGLTAYVFEWSVAPPLGVALAAVGLWLVVRNGRSADPRVLTLAGLAVAIPVGQLYFWGTLNAIGSLDDPGLGLMGHLGPYYHLGLVVPTAAFGAHALVAGWTHLRPRLTAVTDGRARAGLAAGLLVAALVASGVGGVAVAGALQDNREVTAAYETAYEPIERETFDDALVFLPTPHGPWLAHPFQYLHNDPSPDGPVVYAQDRDVFAVLDAFPDRTPYRYSYRGEWVPVGGRTVEPRLQRLDAVAGDAVRLDAAAGLPERADAVILRVESSEAGRTARAVPATGESVEFAVTVDNGSAWVAAPGLDANVSVPVADRDDVVVDVFVDAGGLDSAVYRLELPVEGDGSTVRALTPRQRVCTGVRECDEGAAYVPGAHRPGVSLATDLRAVPATSTGDA